MNVKGNTRCNKDLKSDKFSVYRIGSRLSCLVELLCYARASTSSRPLCACAFLWCSTRLLRTYVHLERAPLHNDLRMRACCYGAVRSEFEKA